MGNKYLEKIAEARHWIGAGVGAVAGAGLGALSSDENRPRNALIGAATGALAGTGAGHFIRKTPAPIIAPIKQTTAPAYDLSNEFKSLKERINATLTPPIHDTASAIKYSLEAAKKAGVPESKLIKNVDELNAFMNGNGSLNI